MTDQTDRLARLRAAVERVLREAGLSRGDGWVSVQWTMFMANPDTDPPSRLNIGTATMMMSIDVGYDPRGVIQVRCAVNDANLVCQILAALAEEETT